MKKHTIAFFAGSTLLLGLSAHANEPVVIFAETFDDLSQWSGPSNNDEGAGRIIETTTLNSEALFGEAGNSYLRLFKADNTSANNAISANGMFSDPSPVVTIAFDFWNSAVGGGQIVLRPAGPSTSNANRVHEIGFARGALSGASAIYEPEQTNRIEIVLNNSLETVFYNEFYSVASDTYDVWIDGVRVLSDHTSSRGSLPVGEDLASLQFAIFTQSWGELLVDDLTVLSGAHVTPVSDTPVPVFAETFEDLSAWGSPTNQVEGQREIGVTEVNSETYFGEANDSYLRFYKNDDASPTSMLITAMNVSFSQVVTVSFDFWQDTTEGLLTGFGFRAGQGTSVPNSHRVNNLTLRNGSINDRPELFQTDQLNNIQIVYNNSVESVTYLDGARTLVADAMDVWLNGALVLADEAFQRGTLAVGEPLRSYQFVGFSNDRTETFIDNFKVYDMPVVFGEYTPPVAPGFTITDFQHDDWSFRVSFTTEAGFSYALEYTDDLTSGNWQLLETRQGTGNIETAWDYGVTGLSARFYRVTQSPN